MKLMQVELRIAHTRVDALERDLTFSKKAVEMSCKDSEGMRADSICIMTAINYMAATEGRDIPNINLDHGGRLYIEKKLAPLGASHASTSTARGGGRGGRRGRGAGRPAKPTNTYIPSAVWEEFPDMPEAAPSPPPSTSRDRRYPIPAFRPPISPTSNYYPLPVGMLICQCQSYHRA